MIMKLLVIVFLLLLGVFQYHLWFGDGGVLDVFRLKKEIAKQEKVNDTLQKRNQELFVKVHDLKSGHAIENLAREQLGMIKKGETYYQFVD